MILTHILTKVFKIYFVFKGIALKELGKFNDALIMYDRALYINPQLTWA